MKWPFNLNLLFHRGAQDLTELKRLLRESTRSNLLSADALSMIEGVIQTAHMRVEEIMIPRAKMVVVPKDAPLKEILEIVTDSAHSRFPVIGDSKDEVVGILLAKDLLYAAANPDKFNLRDILRPASFIPENKRLDVLLNEFRATRNHLAIVVDEYGGILGLITIEDVLEQIVGEIEDEHDKEIEEPIHRHSDGTYTVKANTEIESINDYFGLDLSIETADTLGGLVTRELGHIPERGETLSLKGLHIEVLHSDARRCHLLRVEPLASSIEPT